MNAAQSYMGLLGEGDDAVVEPVVCALQYGAQGSPVAETDAFGYPEEQEDCLGQGRDGGLAAEKGEAGVGDDALQPGGASFYGAAFLVEDRGIGRDGELPARALGSETEVGVLEVHEDSLEETA